MAQHIYHREWAGFTEKPPFIQIVLNKHATTSLKMLLIFKIEAILKAVY